MTVKKLIKELQKIEKKCGPNTTIVVDLDAHANLAGGDYKYEKVQYLNIIKNISFVDDGIATKRTYTVAVINEGLGL